MGLAIHAYRGEICASPRSPAGRMRKNYKDYSDDGDHSMPKGVQPADETHETLTSRKIGGLSFEDVGRRLMEDEDPERSRREYRAWQTRVLRNMKESGEYEPL